MKRIYLLFLSILLLTGSAHSLKAQSTQEKKYVKVPAGYLMVLTEGDNILEHLESFAKEINIPSANFTGMGFVNITYSVRHCRHRLFRDNDHCA